MQYINKTRSDEIQLELEKSKNTIVKKSATFIYTLIFLFFSTSIMYFIFDAYMIYKKISTHLKENYVQLQKDIIKSRVNDVERIISSTLEDSEKTVKSRVQDRVEQAYNIASNIYNNNRLKEQDSVVMDRIKEALRPLRWNNGRSYIWIVDYDNNAVLSPEDSKLEGKSLKNFKDESGNYVVLEQTRTATRYGHGFSKDYFTKFDMPKNLIFPQIAFVKDFKHFNWYFGSAEFIDDYKDGLKSDLLQRVAKIRYEKNYIFINDLKGNVLLGNGVLHADGKNIANLTDQNGVKVFQEELKIVNSNADGGFLEYTWFENRLSKNIKKICYVKKIPELNWMIGTSIPVVDINIELEHISNDIMDDVVEKIIIASISFGVLLILANLTLKRHNKKIEETIELTKDELVKSYSELEDINYNLEVLINKETSKRLEQEKLLMQQSILAMMGEMIGAIAHQWRQPLNALGLMIQEVQVKQIMNEITDESVDVFVADAMGTIKRMSQTIDDFRNFFKPNKEKIEFDIGSAVEETLKILLPQLKNRSIDVVFNKQDISHSIFGYQNEIEQAIMIMISNAQDALVENKTQDPKIKITLQSIDNNKIQLSIHDNAGGIPETIIDRVFEPYFTTKHQAQGTGIGLYMAKEIIERQMNGKLYVENVNGGARFVVEV